MIVSRTLVVAPREFLQDAVPPETMQRLAEQADAYMAQQLGNLSEYGTEQQLAQCQQNLTAAMVLEAINGVDGVAREYRAQARRRMTGLATLRDLLLPQRFMMHYPDPHMIWRSFDAYPRIDPETAARSKERARGLLKSLLTPEQWAEFEAGGAITEQIDGCEFMLRPGGMIEAHKPRLIGRAVRERWCVYPDPYADKNDYMPVEDKLIGQLLHLRAGPDQLRRQANVFPG